MKNLKNKIKLIFILNDLIFVKLISTINRIADLIFKFFRKNYFWIKKFKLILVKIKLKIKSKIIFDNKFINIKKNILCKI